MSYYTKFCCFYSVLYKALVNETIVDSSQMRLVLLAAALLRRVTQGDYWVDRPHLSRAGHCFKGVNLESTIRQKETGLGLDPRTAR